MRSRTSRRGRRVASLQHAVRVRADGAPARAGLRRARRQRRRPHLEFHSAHDAFTELGGASGSRTARCAHCRVGSDRRVARPTDLASRALGTRRARSADTGRGREDQQGDRDRAPHQRPYGRPAPGEHLRQAGCDEPGRGDRVTPTSTRFSDRRGDDRAFTPSTDASRNGASGRCSRPRALVRSTSSATTAGDACRGGSDHASANRHHRPSDRRSAERRVPPVLLRLRSSATICSRPTRSSTCCRRCGGSSSRDPVKRSPRSCARSPRARSRSRWSARSRPARGLRDRARRDAAHPNRAHVTARRMHLCEVRNDQICAVTTYCNGGWDDELRARHAAEAPMVRP